MCVHLDFHFSASAGVCVSSLVPRLGPAPRSPLLESGGGAGAGGGAGSGF